VPGGYDFLPKPIVGRPNSRRKGGNRGRKEAWTASGSQIRVAPSQNCIGHKAVGCGAEPGGWGGGEGDKEGIFPDRPRLGRDSSSAYSPTSRNPMVFSSLNHRRPDQPVNKREEGKGNSLTAQGLTPCGSSHVSFTSTSLCESSITILINTLSAASIMTLEGGTKTEGGRKGSLEVERNVSCPGDNFTTPHSRTESLVYAIVLSDNLSHVQRKGGKEGGKKGGFHLMIPFPAILRYIYNCHRSAPGRRTKLAFAPRRTPGI